MRNVGCLNTQLSWECFTDVRAMERRLLYDRVMVSRVSGEGEEWEAHQGCGVVWECMKEERL